MVSMSYILKVHISVLMWENKENISVVKKKYAVYAGKKKSERKVVKNLPLLGPFI